MNSPHQSFGQPSPTASSAADTTAAAQASAPPTVATTAVGNTSVPAAYSTAPVSYSTAAAGQAHTATLPALPGFMAAANPMNLNDVYRSLLLHSMMVGSNGNVSLPPNTPQYAAPMFMSGFPGLAYGTLQQPYQMASVAATTTPFTPQQSLAPPQSVAVTTTTLPPNAAQQSSPRSSHQSVSDSDAEDRNGSSSKTRSTSLGNAAASAEIATSPVGSVEMPTSVSVLQQPPQSTAQQQSLPSATQQQSLPSTTQQHPSPSTTQQHSLPSTAQQHSLPSTAQQHSLPSATQQHSLPSATQQQPLPSTTQQQSLPSTTQQHPSQSTTQQQPQFASLQMAMQPNAPLQLASATNASETPSASSHSQGASGTSTAEARAGDNPLPQITDSETTGEHHATDEHGVKKLQFEPVPVTYRDRYKNSFDIESNNSATPGLIYSFQLVDGDPATVGYFVCGRCSALDKKHAIPTVKVAFNKLVTDPDNPLNRRCKGSAVHFCCATSTQSPHSRLARGTNATKSYSTRKSSARLAKASADGSTQASEHEKAAPALPTSPLMVPVEKRHDSSAKASPESKKRGRVRPAKKSDSDSSEDDFLDCGKKKRPVKKERTGSEDVYEIDEQSEGAVEPSNATGDESGTVARSPDVVHSKPPFHYGKATFVDARKKSFLTNSRLYPNAQFTFEDTESEFSSGGRLYRRYRCQDCSAILEGEAVKGDMPDMLVTDGYVVSNPDMPSGQPHICIENNQSDA